MQLTSKRTNPRKPERSPIFFLSKFQASLFLTFKGKHFKIPLRSQKQITASPLMMPARIRASGPGHQSRRIIRGIPIDRLIIPATATIVGATTTTAAPHGGPQTTFLFEIAPAFHGDLGGIELSLVGVAGFVGTTFLARGFAGVTPGEVVEVPESVDGKDEVPDGQRQKIDQHPEDVRDVMSRDDDEDTWKTEDESEEDQGDHGSGCVGDGGFNAESD